MKKKHLYRASLQSNIHPFTIFFLQYSFLLIMVNNLKVDSAEKQAWLIVKCDSQVAKSQCVGLLVSRSVLQLFNIESYFQVISTNLKHWYLTSGNEAHQSTIFLQNHSPTCMTQCCGNFGWICSTYLLHAPCFPPDFWN